jgi:D-alanyl-D-alanine carboxypeptidase (penicillin-binding protein 5/6)
MILFLSLLIAYCSLLITAVNAGEISARSAVVIESSSEKILYAKNPNIKLPPASTTKLITAMVALDRLNPDSVISISRDAADTPSVTPRLRSGERYSVRDLLHLSLMRSVNGAAVALAEAAAGSEEAFAAMMNEKAAALGAENTKFINASGLPGEGQYITAFDLSKLMKESLKYSLIKEIINTRAKEIFTADGRRIFLKNTNQLLWTDDDLLGGKTGYTRAARHCFVCAAQRGQSTLIVAILGESARDNLWDDTMTLLSKGYDVLTHKSEPVVYFSRADEEPVVRASYKANAKKSRLHKNARNIKISKSKNKSAKAHKSVVKKVKYKKSKSVNTVRNGADKYSG